MDCGHIMADDLYLSAVDFNVERCLIPASQYMGSISGIGGNLVGNLFAGLKTLASGLPS
ncbi:Uncharacterised protein [Corynebacterium renale]|uniref:Uncharacterized protein n=1 Tax=Corynebacterium renale TaxID=1724 RepID=A0A2A9DNC4_9CORY|nr:hypothetical protein ATK06_0455 [Corynebacterium renale]SQI23514.1 Uncharacterised protein [Corynebacterium renale]